MIAGQDIALMAIAASGAFALTACVARWLRRRRQRKLYGSM